jgi:hypothetical protein
MDEQPQYYGSYHRFYIDPFVSSRGHLMFVVRDANWITDDEIFHEGRSSPTVAIFRTRKEALRWCRDVEEGKTRSEPHEANFEGWPALKERVHWGVK